MNIDKRDLKKWAQSLKDSNPVKMYKEDDALVIQAKDGKRLEDLKSEGHVLLVVIDGDTTEVKKAKKDADDLALNYESKTCAITSKPLVVDGLQMYFTKPGFLGTMAINKDTLLAGDLYNPSTGVYERKLDADRFSQEDLKKHSIEKGDYEHDKENGNYVIKEDAVGSVEMLNGSKKTLRTMNEGKRLRKLLQPSSKNLTTLAIYVGLGFGLGFGTSEYM